MKLPREWTLHLRDGAMCCAHPDGCTCEQEHVRVREIEPKKPEEVWMHRQSNGYDVWWEPCGSRILRSPIPCEKDHQLFRSVPKEEK